MDETRPGPGAISRSGAGPSVLDDELAPGAQVGEYVVERLLASGGQGAVYVARHRVLGRRAALKVLRRTLASSPQMTARFVREARVVNVIGHPNIVDIYDIGALPDGRPFCVMELLRGRSLFALLAERGALPAAEVLALLEPVAAALQAAHDAGVIHRDVKASNVFVAAEGEAPRVKLLDFGVAKVEDPGREGLTAVGQRVGSVHAMAPEQIRGEPVDPRTDVYALGVLLHQMLTGRYPFAATDPAELERLHLEAAPPRPSTLAPVPPALDAVVARCLEKDPERRWTSARAVVEAFRAALAGPCEARRLVPAVAIHVALATAEGQGDDSLLDQADAAEAAEGELRGAGYALPLAVPAAVLGVRLLPDEPWAAAAARAEAVALGQALHRALQQPHLLIAVSVHAADAEVAAGPEGPTIAGGPVCDAAAWATRKPGFLASEAALRPG